MKAIVRFYSTKTGELLRSQQINVRIDGFRTIYDPPITVRANEEFRIQPIFENPILRPHDPDAPKSTAFKATAEALGLNITEVGKPIIKHESTPARDQNFLDPINRLRFPFKD